MLRKFLLQTGAAGAALLATAMAPLPAHAQSSPLAVNTSPSQEGGESSEVGTALARNRYAVVVDLDQNRLFFKKGALTLWSAPIGTGTGLQLEHGDETWNFSTPRGVFHVKYKEKNPVWVAPDWFYVENKLPVPPPDSPKRFYPGGLGAAAVYLDHDLAIHGTDKPELVGQRVSHGCIRLTDQNALRLFHDVEVGTEVIIVGSKHEPVKVGSQGGASTFDPANEKPKVDETLEGWKKLETSDLLAVLGDQLWLSEDNTRWADVAGLLLERAASDGDEEAVEGLLSNVGDLPNERTEREYDAILASTYTRMPLLTLRALSDMDRTPARRAAEAIVTASMELYHGDYTDIGAPWPTGRILASQITEDEEPGWKLLVRAQKEFREQLNG